MGECTCIARTRPQCDETGSGYDITIVHDQVGRYGDISCQDQITARFGDGQIIECLSCGIGQGLVIGAGESYIPGSFGE